MAKLDKFLKQQVEKTNFWAVLLLVILITGTVVGVVMGGGLMLNNWRDEVVVKADEKQVLDEIEKLLEWLRWASEDNYIADSVYDDVLTRFHITEAANEKLKILKEAVRDLPPMVVLTAEEKALDGVIIALGELVNDAADQAIISNSDVDRIFETAMLIDDREKEIEFLKREINKLIKQGYKLPAENLRDWLSELVGTSTDIKTEVINKVTKSSPSRMFFSSPWRERFWSLVKRCPDPKVRAVYDLYERDKKNAQKLVVKLPSDWQELYNSLRNAEDRVARLGNKLGKLLSEKEMEEIYNILNDMALPTDKLAALEKIIETRSLPVRGWLEVFWDNALKLNDPNINEAHRLYGLGKPTSEWQRELRKSTHPTLVGDYNRLHTANVEVSQIKNKLEKFFSREKLDEYVRHIIDPFKKKEKLLALADDFGIRIGQSPGWKRRFWSQVLEFAEGGNRYAREAYDLHAVGKPDREFIPLLEKLTAWEDGFGNAAEQYLGNRRTVVQIAGLKNKLRSLLNLHQERGGGGFHPDTTMRQIEDFFTGVSSPYARKDYLDGWIAKAQLALDKGEGFLHLGIPSHRTNLQANLSLLRSVPREIDLALINARAKMVRIDTYLGRIGKVFNSFDFDDPCVQLGMISKKQGQMIQKIQGLFAKEMLVWEKEIEVLLADFRGVDLTSEEALFKLVQEKAPYLSNVQVMSVVKGGENSVVGKAIKDTLIEVDEIIGIARQGRAALAGSTDVSLKICRFSKVASFIKSKPSTLTVVPLCLALTCLTQAKAEDLNLTPKQRIKALGSLEEIQQIQQQISQHQGTIIGLERLQEQLRQAINKLKDILRGY